MQNRITRAVMSGIGVATLATLSLFATKSIDQVTGDSLSAKANGDSGKVRLACGGWNEPRCPRPAAVGGVRG
jgi:hypothetical protein